MRSAISFPTLFPIAEHSITQRLSRKSGHTTVHPVPLRTFQSTIRYGRDGHWWETSPARCGQGHDLTQPRAMLVGWDSNIDPPHRIWICTSCGEVTHNLDIDAPHKPMRPVRLDHCHPHRRD